MYHVHPDILQRPRILYARNSQRLVPFFRMLARDHPPLYFARPRRSFLVSAVLPRTSTTSYDASDDAFSFQGNLISASGRGVRAFDGRMVFLAHPMTARSHCDKRNVCDAIVCSAGAVTALTGVEVVDSPTTVSRRCARAACSLTSVLRHTVGFLSVTVILSFPS